MLKLAKLGTYLAAGLLSSSLALAEDFYIDVGTDFNASGSSATDAMNSITDHYWSTTTINDSNNDGVYSAGDTTIGSGGLHNTAPSFATNTVADNSITSFVPAFGETNGYATASGWALSFGWTDLMGTVNAFGGITYTSGTIHIYYGDHTDGALGSLTAGTMHHVMDLEVTAGGGNAIGQSLNLDGIITLVSEDYFFWAADDVAFEAMAVSFATNQNTEPYYVNGVLQVGGIAPGSEIYGGRGGSALLQGEHDGSMTFSRVPEPGTLALFALGLLGLTRIARKTKV